MVLRNPLDLVAVLRFGLLFAVVAALAKLAAKVDALKKDWPEFAAMRRLALRFRGMLKSKNVDKLGVWLKDAQRSGLYASNVSLARCRGTSTP